MHPDCISEAVFCGKHVGSFLGMATTQNDLFYRFLVIVSFKDELLASEYFYFDAVAQIIIIQRMHISGHIRLRSASDSDTEFARVVHHRALREVVVRQFGPWNEKLQNGFFEQSGFPDGFEIIEYDGTPCGYLRTEASSTESEVHNLYIDPEFQRRGIGSFLLERVIALGKPVNLQVLFENTEAAQLYKRLGFNVVGETDTHFKMRLHQ